MRPDRNDPLAPAIRRTLQASRTDCPDAEAIAAYAERSLANAERRGVELHLSSCARCRETLLLMSRAAEADTPASSSPRFLLYRWPWLAGAAATGVAIVIWMAVPPSAVRAPESDRFAQIAAEAPKEQAPVPPPVQPEQSAANKAPAELDRIRKKGLPSASRSQPPAAGAAIPPSPAARQTVGERERQEGLADERRDKRKLEEAEQRRANAGKPASALEAPPAAAAPAPAPAPQRESVATDAASPALMARQNQKRDGDYVIAGGSKARSELAAAVPAIMWRVWASGVVERSADGGATWTREVGVEAPAARAVQSPTADVCWIVGDNGLILRFDTGRGWTRLTAPAPIGFVAIEAPDALRAAITAADGRRFTTTDGGRTWQ